MANSGITWGKPLIEFGLTGAEDAAPSAIFERRGFVCNRVNFSSWNN